MHELSIASAILDRVTAAAEQNAGARVTKVGLRVGELASVDPDALAFGFEALAKGTALADAVLEIEYRKRKQRCTACNLEFEPGEISSNCPACNHADTVCIAGKELDISFIEVEGPPCA
jgi:hydrogenase nickel incorporation protein HypA/HybF